MKDDVISIQGITKKFTIRTGDIQILKGIDFSVQAGDFLIIFGPSGCGKSTLLHIMLGLEEPTGGKIIFLGKDLYAGTSEDMRSDFRKNHIGMVYQQPNWIKALTVIENLTFPLLLLGRDHAEARGKALKILETVNMSQWADYIPTELSSGQQQRIALARALVTDPEVIIADEPTGNLDYESGQILMQLLTDLNKSQNKTIVMVTHDLEYIKYAKTAIKMIDGAIKGTYNQMSKNKLMSEIKGKRGSQIN